MTSLIFRCPNTGLNVQAWLAEEAANQESADVFEPITCTACSQLHWVNPGTGKILGVESQ